MAPTLAEQAIALNRGARRGAGGPAAILLTDLARLPEPAALLPRLPPGSLVILREYALADRVAHARALHAACRRHGHAFLLAGDWRLAVRLGADGVHLPEALVPRAPVRRLRAWGLIVTAACHGRAALLRAERAGVDAALVSAVFPTASHPGAPAMGAMRLAALVRTVSLPVFALGGINALTAPRLRGGGVSGIAAVSGFAELH